MARFVPAQETCFSRFWLVTRFIIGVGHFAAATVHRGRSIEIQHESVCFDRVSDELPATRPSRIEQHHHNILIRLLGAFILLLVAPSVYAQTTLWQADLIVGDRSDLGPNFQDGLYLIMSSPANFAYDGHTFQIASIVYHSESRQTLLDVRVPRNLVGTPYSHAQVAALNALRIHIGGESGSIHGNQITLAGSFNFSGPGNWSVGDTVRVRVTAPGSFTATAPGSPRNLLLSTRIGVQVGRGELFVRWDSPSDEGSGVTDYQLRYKRSGQSFTNFQDFVVPVSEFLSKTSQAVRYRQRLNGLGDSTDVTVEVRARSGSSAGPSNSTVGRTRPAIRSIQVVSSPGADGVYTTGDKIELDVIFSETLSSASIGDSPPTLKLNIRNNTRVLGFNRWIDEYQYFAARFSYTVRSSDSAHGGVRVPENALNKRTGEFRVSNTDAVLTNAAKTFANHPIDRRPGEPKTFHGTADGTAATLRWTKPKDFGFSITNYELRHRVQGETWGAWTTFGGARTTSRDVANLTDMSTHEFELRAVNSRGKGRIATTLVEVGRVPAPIGLSVSVSGRTATLSWTTPLTGITKYQYRYRAGSSAWNPDWTDIPNSGASTTSYAISNLRPGTSFTFEIRGFNSLGAGEAASTTGMTGAVPDAPTGLAISYDSADSEVDLSWTDPSDSTITKYQYQVETLKGSNNGSDTTRWTDVSGSSSTTTGFSLTAPSSGPCYLYRVRARNSNGPGDHSEVSTASSGSEPGTPPNATMHVSLDPNTAGAKNGEWYITWSDGCEGGSAITKHQYFANRDGNAGAWHDILPANVSKVGGVNVFKVTNPNVAAVKWGALRHEEQAPPPGVDDDHPLVQEGFWKYRVGTYLRAVNSNGTGRNVLIFGKPVNYRFEMEPLDWSPGFTNPEIDEGESARVRLSIIHNATPAPGQPREGLDGPFQLNWTVDGKTGSSTFAKGQGYVDLDIGQTIDDHVDTGDRNVVFALTGTNKSGMTIGSMPPQIAFSVVETDVPPEAVMNLQAEPGNGAATLSWDEASRNVNPITKYQFRFEEVGKGFSAWRDVANSGPRTTSFTYPSNANPGTPLKNATMHTFEVRAVNAVGAGPATSTDVVPIHAPYAPRDLTATAGAGEVTLTWSRPVEGGPFRASPIGYQVRWRSYRDGSNSLPSSWGPERTSSGWLWVGDTFDYLATELDNDFDYEFEVRATSRFGPSPPSVSARSMPREVGESGIPGVPRSLTVRTNNSSRADLSWQPPAHAGGSRLWGYRIEASDSDGPWDVLVENTQNTKTKWRDTEIPDLRARRYRIRAINAEQGVGEPTPPVSLPLATLEQFYSRHGLTGTSIQVLFNLEHPDGRPLYLRFVEVGNPNAEPRVEQVELTKAGRPVMHEFDGFKSRTTYRVTADFVNTFDSSRSVSDEARTIWPWYRGTVGAPQGLPLVEVSTDGGNTWGRSATMHLRMGKSGDYLIRTAPCASDEEGEERVVEAKIRDTHWTATLFSGPIEPTWVQPKTRSLTCKANQPGSSKSVAVRARPLSEYREEVFNTLVVNTPIQQKWRHLVRNGGADAEALTANTAPVTVWVDFPGTLPKPRARLVDPDGKGDVRITWNSVESATNYQVQWAEGNGGWSNYHTTNTGENIYPQTSNRLRLRVRGYNDSEVSDWSNLLERAAAKKPPDAPRNLEASVVRPDFNAVDLVWDAPAKDNGSPVTGYRIEVSKNFANNWSRLVSNTGSTATEYQHTGLSRGDTRFYRVSAINAEGVGARSDMTRAVLADPPGAPQNFTVTSAGEAAVQLAWEAATDNGGVRISSYKIESCMEDCTSDNAWGLLDDILVSESSGSEFEYAHTGLSSVTEWLYRVRAVNAVGEGEPTAVVSLQMPPSVPRGLTATQNLEGVVDLTWNVPEDTGTPPLDQYRVRVCETACDQDANWSDIGLTVAPPDLQEIRFRHLGLDSGVSRWYRVSAENLAGSGPLTEPVRGMTQATPKFSVADSEGNENSGELIFTVTLQPAAQSDVTVDYATADGTATDGSDYTATSGTLTFLTGETTKFVSVTLIDDNIEDDGETFTLTLSNASSGVTIEDAQATGTIRNTEGPPALAATFPQSAYTSSSHTGTSDLPQVVVAFNRTVIGVTSGTPSVQLTGATISYAQAHTEDGLTNAWIYVLKPTGNDALTFRLVPGNACDDGGICDESDAMLSTVPDPRTIPGPAGSSPLTATFEDVPATHDGSTFKFNLVFSEDVKIGWKALRDDAFVTTGGTMAGARRLEQGKNLRWEMEVDPASDEAVTIELAGWRACGTTGAICTKSVNQRQLVNSVSVTVAGPATETTSETETETESVNNAATGAPTISGTAQVGETLTASTDDITDDNGLDNVSYSYRWIRSGTDIESAMESTYELVDDDEGETISVRVTFTDDDNHAESLTSAATSVVAPKPNSVATGSPTISGTVQVGQTLTALTEDITDDNGLDSVSYSYQWIRSGTDIDGATESSYELVDDDEGETIAVRVTFTDDDDNDESLTSAATEAVAAVGNTIATGLPTISGTVQVGQTLIASIDGITDANGSDNVRYSYQWIRSGTDIEGATESTYELVDDDEGETIAVRVSFTDDDNHAESLTSAVTAVVAPKPNSVATGSPTISGTAQVDQTLTASTSGIQDADGLDNVSFEYQWIRSGTDISQATASTYTLLDADKGETIAVRVSFTDDEGNSESLTSDATGTVAGRPLTASFTAVPDEHDGTNEFTFTLTFSEEPKVSFRVLKNDAFTTTGGSVTKARRQQSGSNLAWTIHVQPSGNANVTAMLSTSVACGTNGSICTEDGRSLSNEPSATILGPPGLSVADARANEGAGATMSFDVTLDRAALTTVTVDYATADDSAQAGQDYSSTNGTLTFAIGETSKTVSVTLLDDDVDEGEEAFKLQLANPSGAYIADNEASGTIVNSDPLPKTWLLRFGRTATDHVLDAITRRFEDQGTESHANVAGLFRFAGKNEEIVNLDSSVGGASLLNNDLHVLGEGTDIGGLGGTSGNQWSNQGNSRSHVGIGTRQLTLRDLLQRSSFQTTTGDTDGDRQLTAWGLTASSRFNGIADGVRVDGDVATYMLGSDARRGSLLTGIALARSLGAGSFRGNAGTGNLSTVFTALHPYARYEAGERLSVWGVSGYGIGDLILSTSADASWHTDTTMLMGAAGVRGVLMRRDGGLEIATRADARRTDIASEGVRGTHGNLAATDGETNRLRLMLEGSRSFVFNGNHQFTPRLEVGVRRDGGDAETGLGFEIGSAFAYTNTNRGLRVETAARMLLAHEDEAYREWGVSTTVRLDPGSAGRGLSLTLTPSWGAKAMGGAERLWSLRDPRELVPGYAADTRMRLTVDVGYGLPAFDHRGSMTPYAGVQSSAFGRDWHAGVRWQLDPQLDIEFEASQRQAAQSVENTFRLHGIWRFGGGSSESRDTPPIRDQKYETVKSCVRIEPSLTDSKESMSDCLPARIEVPSS